MQKTTFLKFYGCLVLFVLVIIPQQTKAQLVIGSPNLQFNQACASDSFNAYDISFVFNPESALAPGNRFNIEMSNAEGDFTDAIVVFSSAPGSITASPASVTFSIPETTSGEGYKLRVKSTEPAATSAPSNEFSAYYKLHDTPFTINKFVSTGAFCPNGSYLLTIDNPGFGDTTSPLLFPSLTFNWYKETGPTSSVFVAESESLSVTEEGTYFAETNYGSCTSNSFSNRVMVSEATAGQTTTTAIESSAGNPFCASEGPTTLSTMNGDSHTWTKDGTVIPGATGRTYQTSESGIYTVTVVSGNCQAIGSIDLESGDFTSSIDVPAINELPTGESLKVTITTTANNPEFEWYLNEELLPDVTGNTYEAFEFGSYRVLVFQNSACEDFDEFTFEIREITDPFPEVANIPNLISPNGDGINDTWVIPTSYVSGTNTEVMILTNQGDVVFQTKEYANNWPEDQLNLTSVNLVYYYIIIPENQDIKKGSITVIQ
ncbi:gliding motility-associated C-terminal domain-containing protein [Rasiella sp. SM2506]|uniref:T9SS type B sorting domain-containing protein n=1 Tax=Rasiella sp. SM2506 TaxID=3423914 RepID=UPI003D799E6B